MLDYLLQIFIVVIFVLFVNVGLFIANFQRQMELVSMENSDNMTRIRFCNTYLHMNIVIVSLMIIQLMCSIQAFRGRNLPSVMNDGITLTYLTFTLSIVFGVSFVIVHFQAPPHRGIFQSAVIVVNNFMICLLMYAQKAIRMVLYPKENTREYFRQQRMAKMEEASREAIEIN